MKNAFVTSRVNEIKNANKQITVMKPQIFP